MTGASDFHRSRLSDQLFARPAAAKRNQRQASQTKPRKSSTPPVRVAVQDPFRFVLVANDGLYFRLYTHADRQRDDDLRHSAIILYPPPPTPTPTPHEPIFRRTFAAVWEGIPVSDRRTLLNRWQARPGEFNQADPWAVRQYWPLIQLMDLGSLASPIPNCTNYGHTLSFLAVEQEESQWLDLIAHTLADVYLRATGVWWELVEKLVEQPLERWERRLGKKATDASGEKEHARLERLFVPIYEAEIQRVLRRWGFARSAVPPMPSTPRPKGQG